MLKFLKSFLLVVGGLVLIGVVVLAVKNTYDITQVVNAANINKSNDVFASPRNWVLIMTAAALVAGLVLGIGLAMPKLTFKQALQQKEADEAKKLADMAQAAVAPSAPAPEHNKTEQVAP
jgi:hypothetical protein